MTTQNLTVMQAMIQKMGWQEERQKVIAQNVANADTPGYRPQDVKELDFKHLLSKSTSSLSLTAAGGGSVDVATTNSKHLGTGGAAAAGSPVKPKDQKFVYETAPAGNAVVLEEQLLKMSENYTNHRLITNLYQKNIDMLKLSVSSR